jgi:hypothetical protein
MGAYRGLAAKCPTDGFRESLARFRADEPTASLPSELAPSLARGEDYSVLRATAGRKRSTSANGVGRVRISRKHLAFNRLLVTQIPFATRSWSMQKTVFGS